MERLKTRAYALAVLLILAGVMFTFATVRRPEPKTEAWMESQMPATVGKFMFVPSAENPMQSYRMDQTTYDLLKPFGIVSRVYRFGAEAYDVVVIASNNRESFHDPSVCFSGQGWNFSHLSTAMVPTKTRGQVPVTLGKTDAKNTESQPNRMAVYFYKGPDGFVSGTLGIKWELFRAQLLAGQATDGVFYRFIPMHPNPSQEHLIAFVGDFLDAANRSSKGYF